MTSTHLPRLAPLVSDGGPLVSVVMPTFRRPGHVAEAIRSLLKGSWIDFELLVRDDGDGRDGAEVAVVSAANGDPRVRYHRNEQWLGMPGNLNAGIADSQGAIIAACYDHDIYKPNYLARMVEALLPNPTVLYVHSANDQVNRDGHYMWSNIGDWPPVTRGRDWLKFMLSSLNCPVCALTLVRREAFERYGLYDPSFGMVADVELWMRLAAHGDVAYVREPLVQIRQGAKDHFSGVEGFRLFYTLARIHLKYIRLIHTPAERVPQMMVIWARFTRRILLERASWMLRQSFLGTVRDWWRRSVRQQARL